MVHRMTATLPARPAAILHPVVDLLCVGGLSILFFVPLLLSGRQDLALLGAGATAWLATLINMPHFMASYRIVYRTRESILAHKWASMGIPTLLGLWVLVAVSQANQSLAMVTLLVAAASGYLAWHYTGQAWGMMASFAALEGVSFTPTERRLVRGSLRVLLAWHVIWFLHVSMNPASEVMQGVNRIYPLLSYATVLAFLAGALGLWQMRQRIGRFPPLRSLVAWAAIFVWYLALGRWGMDALFWVQIAHAIQYLEFPIRVEMNYAVRRKALGLATHMAVFGVALLGISVLMAQVVPQASMLVLANWLGEEPGRVAPALILSFINIHHYFTDQVAWKLRNPEVQRDLFAHIPALAAAAPGKGKGKAR